MLDTNTVSETRKPRPNPGLLDWLSAQDPAHLFTTTVTLAEVWHGFHCLPPTHSDYDSIKRFATDLPRKYRVLNFDARAAAIWGELTAQANGPLPLRDSFIAAISVHAIIASSRVTPRRLSAWAARWLIRGSELWLAFAPVR